VRIIAATNQDLRANVEKGTFREDLYFRLNVFPIEFVPLRQRREDIPLLAQHFLNRAKERANKRALRIPLSQLEKLKNYSWPGNIREMENIIERQVILAKNDSLRFEFFDHTDARTDEYESREDSHSYGQVKTEYDFRELEKENLVKALRQARGKVSGENGAAQLLAIPSTTLSSKLKKFGLTAAHYK